MTRLCPDMELHLGYTGTWIPHQPLTRSLCKTFAKCIVASYNNIWFLWDVLGVPTTRFCRRQLLINRNHFSRFVTTDAVLYKPIPNIRDKSKFDCLQASLPCAMQVEA